MKRSASSHPDLLKVLLHLKPLTLTAADVDQSDQAGDQNASEEYGCEEEKRYRKHVYREPRTLSRPTPWNLPRSGTDQVYTLGVPDATITLHTLVGIMIGRKMQQRANEPAVTGECGSSR